MKILQKITLVLVFISLAINTLGQKNKEFVTNIKGINNRVDSLPCFIYEKTELDTFLLNNQILLPQLEIWGVNVKISASFLVDTLAKPYGIVVSNVNVKINALTEMKDEKSAATIKEYYSKESARLIALTEGMWLANSSNYKNKLNIILAFNTDAYDAKNQEALKIDHDHKPGDIYKDTRKQGEAKSILNIYNYYDFGVKKLNQNKLLIAQKYFEQALKIKNDDIDALYNLGICFIKQKKRDQACESWNKGKQFGDKEVQGLLDRYCTK